MNVPRWFRLSASIRLLARAARCASALLPFCLATAWAAQIDIHGPAGSVFFGGRLAALPNGNIVIVDSGGPISSIGAVYLYAANGSLINYFTGASTNDRIGSGGIAVLANGNFVIASPYWSNGAQAEAGAVTWVDGTTGLSGVVSIANSIYGTTANDHVGRGVAALANGNYVVVSDEWQGGKGAVTWVNGSASAHAAVSSQNSLVGSAATDEVGSNGVTTLGSGNYVVKSPSWNVGSGAATWANGSTGIAGAVSLSNSLIGPAQGDHVGSDVKELSNGNFVVLSPDFTNSRGAATWVNGPTGMTGTVTPASSLVGNTAGDHVGSGGVVSLANGHYVVASPSWNGGRGAVTLLDGAFSTSAFVISGNSLVGAAAGDNVPSAMIGLNNGNFVVASRLWNGTRGAVTWVNGTTGLIDTVAASNSLVGSAAGDYIGTVLVGLTNGNYVSASSTWNGSTGAAIWGQGTTGITGVVSSLNALTGSATLDRTGSRVAALSNGNYVVTSPTWNGQRGAATWVNGATGSIGVVSAANSLVGVAPGDEIGFAAYAVGNGNYAVTTPYWNAGRGAVTWANGITGLVGTFSPANSLVGTSVGDNVSISAISRTGDGNYVITSPNWQASKGAITLASGAFALTGTIQPWNSVQGNGNYGIAMVSTYDDANHRLIVGRPPEGIVSIFTMDQVFASRFE